jgi:hypothetical protein
VANGNDSTDTNGRSPFIRGGVLVGSGLGVSIGGVISLLTWVQGIPAKDEISTLRHQAATSLEVAKQHGEEFAILRNDFSALRAALEQQIKSAADDRFHGSEWEVHDRRIEERFDQIERRLDDLEGR